MLRLRSFRLRSVVLFLAIFVFFNYLLIGRSTSWDDLASKTVAICDSERLSAYRTGAPHGGPFDASPHPIPVLIADARRRHRALLRTKALSVEEAAAAYRQRRGRHPPPGFDAWVKHALKNEAVLVEGFWDRIYHDLTPFWGLDAKEIAWRARDWEHVIRVRKGKASFVGNVEGRVPWMQLWTALVKEAAQHLPDVDIPINMMDEPRLLVPWEIIAKYVEEEKKMRRLRDKTEVTTKFAGPPSPDHDRRDVFYSKWYDKRTPYWELARLACSPDSPSHDVLAINDFANPTMVPDDYDPAFAFSGYITNFTASADVCTQPHLRGMHGSLILPISLNTSQDLLPLFGGSKLQVNNEILIPGAMYLTDDKFYSGGSWTGPRWTKKKDGAVWRGDATGGQNTPENWAHFQRHRLVQMLNGTVVSAMEANGTSAPTFALPPEELYPSARRHNGSLGTWLSSFSNAGFVHRLCEDCSYVDPYLPAVEGLEMAEQYQYKFLPDADGNSFSARFRGFLRSTSVPLKATIYAEWHDDRLAPWVHFIPLDNSFRDIYSVLEFFGDAGDPHSLGIGDDAARTIADEGKAWAEKVLRREDMVIYVWRLLLEWARVCDANRDTLGYVEDL